MKKTILVATVMAPLFFAVKSSAKKPKMDTVVFHVDTAWGRLVPLKEHVQLLTKLENGDVIDIRNKYIRDKDRIYNMSYDWKFTKKLPTQEGATYISTGFKANRPIDLKVVTY